MKLITENTHQKLRGGYYTPKQLTDFIVDWAFRGSQIHKVLEPSCGDGAFLESLAERNYINEIDVTAIELIEEEANKAKTNIEGYNNFKVINDDFFSCFEITLKHQRFDLIIGNPPYIRYQYLSAEQRETQSDILVSNGMKSNKLINAWVSFVVACVQILGTNSKIGMVIPAELLQVAYAEELRLFLVNNLTKITVVTFKELVFPDVQQEVVLLLGEKNNFQGERENTISVIEVNNLDSLHEQFYTSEIDYKEVDHSSDKWTKYFLENQEIMLINQIKQHQHFVKFEEVATIDIGITTGNNKYFSVTKDVVEKFELNDLTLPLIGRSAHASGVYFTYEDWQKNINKGVPAQLVYFPDESFEHFSEGHKAYIRWGEENGHNAGYKCSIRRNWYHIPSVWVPHAFFLRRNDTYPKFVLNSIDAVSTDTMHRIRFNDGLDHEKVLLSYYNSITFAFTEIEGRSYGGGVLEVLPGEVEKIMLPDLQKMDSNLVRQLINKLDRTIRGNKDIEVVLDEIDQKVLVDYLGIDAEVVRSFRIIWKKLMDRRRNRKQTKTQGKIAG